jgi:hypothetical protein
MRGRLNGGTVRPLSFCAALWGARPDAFDLTPGGAP